jgi:hypothetical protein
MAITDACTVCEEDQPTKDGSVNVLKDTMGSLMPTSVSTRAESRACITGVLVWYGSGMVAWRDGGGCRGLQPQRPSCCALLSGKAEELLQPTCLVGFRHCQCALL